MTGPSNENTPDERGEERPAQSPRTPAESNPPARGTRAKRTILQRLGGLFTRDGLTQRERDRRIEDETAAYSARIEAERALSGVPWRDRPGADPEAPTVEEVLAQIEARVNSWSRPAEQPTDDSPSETIQAARGADVPEPALNETPSEWTWAPGMPRAERPAQDPEVGEQTTAQPGEPSWGERVRGALEGIDQAIDQGPEHDPSVERRRPESRMLTGEAAAELARRIRTSADGLPSAEDLQWLQETLSESPSFDASRSASMAEPLDEVTGETGGDRRPSLYRMREAMAALADRDYFSPLDDDGHPVADAVDSDWSARRRSEWQEEQGRLIEELRALGDPTANEVADRVGGLGYGEALGAGDREWFYENFMPSHDESRWSPSSVEHPEDIPSGWTWAPAAPGQSANDAAEGRMRLEELRELLHGVAIEGVPSHEQLDRMLEEFERTGDEELFMDRLSELDAPHDSTPVPEIPAIDEDTPRGASTESTAEQHGDADGTEASPVQPESADDGASGSDAGDASTAQPQSADGSGASSDTGESTSASESGHDGASASADGTDASSDTSASESADAADSQPESRETAASSAVQPESSDSGSGSSDTAKESTDTATASESSDTAATGSDRTDAVTADDGPGEAAVAGPGEAAFAEPGDGGPADEPAEMAESRPAKDPDDSAQLGAATQDAGPADTAVDGPGRGALAEDEQLEEPPLPGRLDDDDPHDSAGGLTSVYDEHPPTLDADDSSPTFDRPVRRKRVTEPVDGVAGDPAEQPGDDGPADDGPAKSPVDDGPTDEVAEEPAESPSEQPGDDPTADGPAGDGPAGDEDEGPAAAPASEPDPTTGPDSSGPGEAAVPEPSQDGPASSVGDEEPGEIVQPGEQEGPGDDAVESDSLLDLLFVPEVPEVPVRINRYEVTVHLPEEPSDAPAQEPVGEPAEEPGSPVSDDAPTQELEVIVDLFGGTVEQSPGAMKMLPEDEEFGDTFEVAPIDDGPRTPEPGDFPSLGDERW